ncbi:hypothetical protein BT93_L4654 [Corymbia citriodora subsp. variegata]|uniref:nicotinamidase n=1 Tax=Corymbia citriodora subsp. variegata TaxID=360336 RepID=A0A8T0CFM2_CORYI|nr:hypothetical protein BT93_L4654 [Corymbia citriodora subsp. variegata]
MASKIALIVVDMQHDFCHPQGSLSVSGAMECVPLVNRLLDSRKISYKVATKDWHPQNHISFASNHDGKEPFTSFIQMSNHVGGKPDEKMQQRLWPDHCVQKTKGSELLSELHLGKVDLIIEKGSDERVEMYSAFSDSFGNMTAGRGGVNYDLTAKLKEQSIDDVYVVGIAGDYCVNYTALDAAKAGFKTYVIEDGQRCVSADSWKDVCQGFIKGGVTVVGEQEHVVQSLLE